MAPVEECHHLSVSFERAVDAAGFDVLVSLGQAGINDAALFRVYSSSAVGSLGIKETMPPLSFTSS